MNTELSGLTARALPFLALGFGIGACIAPSDIEEIKSDQKKILEKLEEIGKSAAARPQMPQQPQAGRPDPSKVYAFPVGESPIKGNKDAWVTVVEVSDFQ